MEQAVIKRTSFIYHQIFAVLSLVATVLFLWYWYVVDLQPQATFLCAFSLIVVLWGIHAIIHYLGEQFFGFDPLF